MVSGLRLQFPSHPDMSETVNQNTHTHTHHLCIRLYNLQPIVCVCVFVCVYFHSNYPPSSRPLYGNIIADMKLCVTSCLSVCDVFHGLLYGRLHNLTFGLVPSNFS